MFVSQIYTLKLNLWPKIDLPYAISKVKRFLEFLSKKIFFLFFIPKFELLMFHNNIVKISEKNEQAELVKNLPPYYSYPTDFCIMRISFYYREKVKISYLKKQTNKKQKQ